MDLASGSNTINTKKHKKHTVSDSDSDSDSDSTSSESYGSDGYEDPEDQDTLEGRFDPLASVDKYTWKLAKGQARHVNKYFMENLPDCVMKKSIIRKAPCPGDST